MTHSRWSAIATHLALLLVLHFITGCAARRPAGPPSPPATEALLFATDRNPQGSGSIRNFGGDRSPALYYGTLLIDIPAGHVPGSIDPATWGGAGPASDQAALTEHDLTVQSHDQFKAQLAAAIKDNPKHEVAVFIHGFNTTFSEWAWRVAQMRHDMNFTGVTIVYSWPSVGGSGGVASYFHDEDNAYWAVDDLENFLAEVAAVAKPFPGSKVHLLAHSLGCRVLTLALEEMHYHHPERLFDQVIYAAADVDADRFRQQDFRKIRTLMGRLTLYASSHDIAIEASKRVHKDARVGEAGGVSLLVMPPVETIDASRVEGSFFGLDLFGHSYFGDCPSVLHDIAGAFAGLAPMDPRRNHKLVQKKDRWGAVYWVLPPGCRS